MAEETGFKNKLIRAFGLEELDEDEYEEAYGEERYYAEEPEPPMSEPAPDHSRYAAPAHPTNVVNNDGTPDVLVLDPSSFEEAPGIVNKLKQNKTIVVNLKETDYEEGRKIFDFLSGAVYALEGSLNRIAESVFILAPQMVHVSTKMDDVKPGSRGSNVIDWESE